MKLLTLLAVMLSFIAPLSAAEKAEGDWRTNYAESLKESASTKRLVLLDFTGSDWCSWCKRLHKEVFSQKEFVDYAKEHLILQIVDFPQHKQIAADVAKQNDELQNKFQIEGYPTIVLVDSTGKEVGRLSYMEGGAKVFVAALRKIVEKQ